MDVRLPNGTVIKNVPEGTSKEAIADKAIAAGLATPEDFAPPPETSLLGENPLTAASSGAIQGIAGIGDVLAVPIREGGRALGFDMPDRPVTEGLRSMGLGQPAQTPSGKVAERIGRPVGETAIGVAGLAALVRSSVMSALSSIPLTTREAVMQSVMRPAAQAPGTTAAAELALGATGGAGQVAAEEMFPDSPIASTIGLISGVAVGATAGPKVINAVTRGVQRLVGRPNIVVMNNAGQFTDEAIQALENRFTQAGVSPQQADATIARELVEDGVLTPEQARRFNLFQSRGVTALRANVTRSTDDARELADAIKRSGPVAQAVAEQDRQLAGLAQEGIEQLRPRAANLPETNANVFAVVNDVVTRADNATQAAYRTAREQAKGQPLVSIDKLTAEMSTHRGSELARPVVSHLRTVLKNKGLIRAGETLDIQKRGPKITGEQTRKMTVREAEEIRQELNSLWDSVTPQGRRVIRALKDALDDDVGDAVGEDIFSQARAAKVEQQRLIERARRDKFDKTKGGFIEDVIDNKIPQEKITQRLLTGRDDDFANFKRFLLDDAGEAGEQAWRDIKAHVIRDAMTEATKGSTTREGGVAFFNHRLFANKFNNLRNTGKWTELFDAEERKLIDDIIQIGSFRAPISGVERGSGPSGFAVDSVKKEIVRRIPVIGEGGVRLFEAISEGATDRRILDPTKQTIRLIEQ